VLTKFFGAVWRYLPGVVRRRMVRIGHPRFTVTAGAFVFDDQNRILLLEHVFRPDSRWGIPGGFLGKGEQPDVALRRELREETALEVSDLEFLFARTLPKQRQVEIYFRCKTAGTPQPSSFEIIKAEWFTTENLPPELSQDQRELIQRALGVGEKSGG
jgi:ADP-ribose pyrophosphatase YjhB (NUDIX family)